jgi:methyl-accepting chemotaxis protein
MEKAKKPSMRRRTYFIEKKFQTNFIIKFCSLVIVGGLLTIGIIYFLAKQSTSVSIVNSRVIVRSTADFLLPVLFQTVAVVVVLIGLAAVGVTLLVSHKIAGPLYRFQKVMQTLTEGDFSKDFRIRKLDQLQSLADEFNNMIRKTRGQLNLLKNNFVSLKSKLDDLPESDVSSQKRTSLKELKSISEELNKIIKYFKS